MKRISLAAFCLVMAAAGWALLVHVGPWGAAAAEPAAVAGVPTLEVGRNYTFSWPHGPLDGTVVEAPRGKWVKVKHPIAEGRQDIYWVNLDTVMHVREGPRSK